MWKTLSGHCIYKTSEEVRVHQNHLYRWLTFGSDALHTLISRRHPEKPRLNYIHQLGFAAREKPGESCLLGLGGAGVAHALAPYLKDFALDAVENNPEIIEIASRFFMTERLTNLSVYHEDANDFVQKSSARYQHLMIDLYDAHSFPSHCNTHDFFVHCRELLFPKGILALNLTNVVEQRMLFDYIRDIFFERTVSLPVKGAANMIVLAYNGSTITPLLDLLKNSGRLKKLCWNAEWGCIAGIESY